MSPGSQDIQTGHARRKNTQLFALPQAPPDEMQLAGGTYRLASVFKHDFVAATCLYHAASGPCRFPKIVVKFARTRDFCGVPLAWLGQLTGAHEQAIYRALEGVTGVPRWAGCPGPAIYAIEYIDALPLDHFEHPPAGFFERLRALFDQVHARGVAYVDSNKRSNILVGPDGEPYLIDFQLSFCLRNDLPWPLAAIVRSAGRYFMDKDLYHLYKHKRRMSPHELTPQEDELSRKRGGFHAVHRKLAKRFRSARRWFLRRQFQKGDLVSPTAGLEDHFQPEKETWRKK